MKSKKLFAILTLVAFLMTLLPMAAFAIDQEAAGNMSASASSLKATNTSVDVYNNDRDNLAKFVVTFRNSARAEFATGDTVDFRIETSTDGATGLLMAPNGSVAAVLSGNATNGMGAEEGLFVNDAVLSTDGKLTFYVGSNLTGSFTVKVGLNDAGDFGNQIGEDVTVQVGSGDGALDLEAWDENGDAELAQIGNDGDTLATAYELESGDGVELHAFLLDGNNPIEGKTVTFKKAYNDGSFSTIGTDVTDEDGEAVFYYEGKDAGDYQFQAVSGDADDSNEVFVTYAAGDADAINDDEEDGTKVAVDYDNTITFIVTDENGNEIQGENVVFDVTSAPAESDFEDFSEVTVATNADGEADWAFQPDKAGKYTIKAKVDNSRISDTITVDALEYGDVTKLELELDNAAGDEVPSLIAEDAEDPDVYDDGNIAVTCIDENGVELDAADLGADVDLQFASANVKALKVAGDGDLALEDEDFAGTVAITVVDKESGASATIDVPIVGAAYSIKPTVTVTGKTADVTLQFVDADGKDTIGTDGETYEIVLPTGVASADVDEFDETGEATFSLEAEQYGKFNITVVSNISHLSKTFAVEFVQPASEIPVIGAKSVTIFIGVKGYVVDGAAKVLGTPAFIEAATNRTFVPFRAIGEALGATCDWNEATKTVTMTRSDMTLTLVIGSNTITKVASAVTTPITMDAEAQIVDGSTMVPARAIAETFGATVTFVDGAMTITQGAGK